MQLVKWLDQIEPQLSVADAAGISLQQRLSAVEWYLPLAANQPKKTDEHVHQLRVWCRRSLAAVILYQDVLPPEQVKWFRKWIHHTRTAAGDARDLDVLLQRYRPYRKKKSYRDVLADLRKRRKKAQRPIRRLRDRLGSDNRLRNRIDQLVDSIERDSVVNNERFQSWAERQINLATAHFFSALPSRSPTIVELHQFRLCGKRLRYDMELLSTAFPKAFRESLYPMVSQLQVRLGDINDHATARDRLKLVAKKRSSKRLKKLIADEKKNIKEARRSFEQWWTAERTNEFFRTLHQITHPSRAG